MIRKFILTTSLLGALVFSGLANTVTTTVNPNGFVNLLTAFPGSTYIKQVTISANTTNAAVLILDTPTNALTYVNPAYTNTISYATNYITSWTNFYGVAQSTTNIALIDVTNNVVASVTNSYPIRLSVSALASTTVPYNNVNTYFNRGIWATNSSSGVATVIITY